LQVSVSSRFSDGKVAYFAHSRQLCQFSKGGRALQTYRNLSLLTAIVIGLVILEAVNQPVVMLIVQFAPTFFAAHVAPIANVVDGASVVILLLTMVVFSYWIYAAGRNLSDSGVEELQFTPASRIWWFAVPFANLVMPFRGMRELWNASQGKIDLNENHMLISAWWALWLINNVTANIVNFVMRDDQTSLTPLWIIAATGAPLAVAAIKLLRGIAAAQRQTGPHELSEVFA
jgi:Domain of unknown function (DUF4328)